VHSFFGRWTNELMTKHAEQYSSRGIQTCTMRLESRGPGPLLGFTGEARGDPGGLGIANGDSDRTSRLLVRVGVTGVVASALEVAEMA
jgi:hypothetical protein